jgi:hypothetical protein
MNFAFDDWQTSGQRDIMGEKDAIRKTHDDFVDCIRYYYQGGWDYYRLKGQMRQQERKAHDDELVDLSRSTCRAIRPGTEGLNNGRRSFQNHSRPCAPHP